MKKQSVLAGQVVKKRPKKRKAALQTQGGPKRPIRQNNWNPAIIRRIFFSFCKIFSLFAIIAAISFSFIFGYHLLLTSPYLELKKLEIKGVEGELKQELIQICNFEDGISILAIRLNDLKEKIESHPWIKSVQIERRFPHTIIIESKKEVAAALVLIDHYYYMDFYGKIFKELQDGEEIDFPIITGIHSKDLQSRTQLNLASQVLKSLESEKGQWSLEELSEIHINKNKTVSLYFIHLGAEIKTRADDILAKLANLNKVANHLRQTSTIHEVSSINLNSRNGIIVTLNKDRAQL